MPWHLLDPHLVNIIVPGASRLPCDALVLPLVVFIAGVVAHHSADEDQGHDNPEGPIPVNT